MMQHNILNQMCYLRSFRTSNQNYFNHVSFISKTFQNNLIRYNAYSTSYYMSKNSEKRNSAVQFCKIQKNMHVRRLHLSVHMYSKEPSKVEETVKKLKEEIKKKDDKSDMLPVPGGLPAEVPSKPKRSLFKRFIDEVIHYYHGFRLLFIDIKISSRLVWKILHGNELTRREHKQLVRTVSDLFRLVPFSIFIIIPFMELLLPVFLKLFPAMLPSTFQTSSDKEQKFKTQLKVKIEMAKFLQDTLENMGVRAKGDTHSHTAKEFAMFFEKIRQSGEQASNDEILKYSKLFEDEITLDNLSRPSLIALCRLLELQPIGTNNFLRFQLRMKLRMLKADDQMIMKEGLDLLTVTELQAACRARGMRALGMPENRLRSQLRQWLELSLNEQIPPSLLLLSRALYLPENLPASEQLKATISSLPDTAATEAKYKIGEIEGKTDNKTKLELIRIEEAAIKKEAEEILQELDKLKEKEEEEVKADTSTEAPTADALVDKAPTLEDKAETVEEQAAEDEKDKISKEDIEELEDALENLAKEKRKLLIEKEEIEDLKEEMADYKQDIEELKDVALETGHKELRESKAAIRLSNKVNKMISKMDSLVEELGKERETLEQKIDAKEKKGVSISKERDDIVSINELVTAIQKITKASDDARLHRIADVLEKMDVDHDGAVEVDHVLKVIELIGKDNVKVSTKQMDEIIELLLKEDSLETEEKIQKEKQQSEDGDSRNKSEQQQS